MVPPARGYSLPDYYEPLRSGPVVEPAGMTSSIPCCQLKFGPSRHCGASYTMATWPLRDWKPAQVAEQGEGERGGETESEGGIHSLGWMRETRQTEQGAGIIGGGDKLAFWSKLTTHNCLSKTTLPVCTGQTAGSIYWHGPILHQGHTYHKTMTSYSKQMGRLKWGGGNRKGHQWVTMLMMEHGPSHSPPGFFSNVLIAVHIIKQNLFTVPSYHKGSFTVARKK